MKAVCGIPYCAGEKGDGVPRGIKECRVLPERVGGIARAREGHDDTAIQAEDVGREHLRGGDQEPGRVLAEGEADLAQIDTWKQREVRVELKRGPDEVELPVDDPNAAVRRCHIDAPAERYACHPLSLPSVSGEAVARQVRVGDLEVLYLDRPDVDIPHRDLHRVQDEARVGRGAEVYGGVGADAPDGQPRWQLKRGRDRRAGGFVAGRRDRGDRDVADHGEIGHEVGAG